MTLYQGILEEKWDLADGLPAGIKARIYRFLLHYLKLRISALPIEILVYTVERECPAPPAQLPERIGKCQLIYSHNPAT